MPAPLDFAQLWRRLKDEPEPEPEPIGPPPFECNAEKEFWNETLQRYKDGIRS